MSSIHPHWQATDTNDGNIRIQPKMPMKQPKRASRRPAALTGIALFVIAGVALFQSLNRVSNVEGQLSGPVTIVISATGVTPSSVTVDPGTTLIWKNDDTIPHIISSETFPTSDGKPFVTSAIFPGSNTHVLVPVNAKGGTHAYISETSQAVNGTIVITGPVGTTTTSMPSSVMTISSASSAVSIPALSASSVSSFSSTIAAVAITGSQASSIAPIAVQTSSRASVAMTGIPTNPHTIGTFAGNVTADDQPSASAMTNVTHYPTSTTETGPGVWIIVILSIGAVLAITQRMFRKV